MVYISKVASLGRRGSEGGLGRLGGKRSWLAPAIGVGTLLADFAGLAICGAAGEHLGDLIRGTAGSHPTLPLAMFVFAGVAGFLLAQGAYSLPKLLDVRQQLLWVFFAFLLAAVSLSLSVFCLKGSTQLSRISTLFMFGSGWVWISTARCIAAAILHRAGVGAYAAEPAVVIADPKELAETGALQNLDSDAHEVVRTIRIDPSDDAGCLSEQIEFIRQAGVRHVFLLLSWNDRKLIDDILAELQVLSIPVSLLPDARAARFVRPGSGALGSFAIQLRRAPLTVHEQRLKRILDTALAFVALFLLSPLMLIIAAAIRANSRGPVFFRQRRRGLDGRQFSILKFRTMNVMDDGPEIRQVVRNDARVTTVGRVLRKLNFDELPQLLNVLRGDMSLVGPRPHAVAHDDEYSRLIGNYLSRHRIKPGMTGWAQINGLRGETSTVDKMASRVDLDLWYVNNWTLTLDVKILLKTLVLGLQKHAY
jgi:undecaprenyl-phosphate galactose phosphotransferase/putative colanic acid biosynthesis UDP-glucose lipid carrier transferase